MSFEEGKEAGEFKAETRTRLKHLERRVEELEGNQDELKHSTGELRGALEGLEEHENERDAVNEAMTVKQEHDASRAATHREHLFALGALVVSFGLFLVSAAGFLHIHP